MDIALGDDLLAVWHRMIIAGCVDGVVPVVVVFSQEILDRWRPVFALKYSRTNISRGNLNYQNVHVPCGDMGCHTGNGKSAEWAALDDILLRIGIGGFWRFSAEGAGSAVCYCLSRFRVGQNFQCRSLHPMSLHGIFQT